MVREARSPEKIVKIEVLGNGIFGILWPSQRVIMSRFSDLIQRVRLNPLNHPRLNPPQEIHNEIHLI